MFKKLILLMILMAGLVIAAAGCGSDDPDGNNGIYTGNNGNNGAPDGGPSDARDSTDDATSDTPDGETDPDKDAADAGDVEGDSGDSGPGTCTGDTGCGAGYTCVEDVCVPADAQSRKCLAAEDLGVLNLNNELIATGNLLDADNVDSTSCAETDGTEMMFRFEAAQDSLVNFDAQLDGQFTTKIEIRSYDCFAESAVDVQCLGSEEPFQVIGGSEYLLVVEVDGQRGGPFEVTLDAEEGCITGSRMCAGDDLQVCNGSSMITLECAAGCEGQNCRGNSCGDPISVSASTTFTGDLAGYSSHYNFADSAEFCSTSDGTAISTPGAELVFELPNLTAGQTIRVDAETDDSNANAIFITNNCGEPFGCTEVNLLNENFEWTAPADGTYYIITDKQFASGDEFQYRIEFQ